MSFATILSWGCQKPKLVPCYDCGRAISFTAAACPHCVSSELGGPDVFSAEEGRRPGEHARNVRGERVYAAIMREIAVAGTAQSI